MNILVMGLMMGLMIFFLHGRGHHQPEPKPTPTSGPSAEDRPAIRRATTPDSHHGVSQTPPEKTPESAPAPKPVPYEPKGE